MGNCLLRWVFDVFDVLFRTIVRKHLHTISRLCFRWIPQVDSLVHQSINCPVCGEQPCTLDLPVLPSWSIELPPCPLTPQMLSGQWKGKLPDKSPIPSLLSSLSETVVEGTASLKKRKGSGDEEELLM